VAGRPHTGISIFSRILIALLLVNLTTSLLLLLMGYDFVKGLIERRTTESIGQQIAVVRARFEEEYLEDTDQWLRWLANSSHLDDYLYAPDTERRVIRKRIERLLKQSVRDFDGIDAATFVESNGTMIVVAPAARRAERGMVLTAEQGAAGAGTSGSRIAAMAGLFAHMQATPLLISSGGMEWFMPPRQVRVEGPFVDDNGVVSAVAGLAKLDVDTGLFGGAVLVNVTLEPFLAELRELKFFGESLIWVLSPNGEVLQRPDGVEAVFDPRSMLPDTFQTGLGLTQTREGIVAFQDFSIVPGEPFLRVAVTVPRSVLLGDLAPAVRYFSIVLMASIVVAFLVSLYVSRYLSRPIVELASAAARLAGGDLQTRVAVHMTGEVQTLVDSFNRMTDDLRTSVAARDQSMATLRREIAERERVEKELRQQARDLREARTAAESAGRAKGDFLATMSHEIRTPINGVLGMTELLLATGLEERQRRLAETAKRSGETLLGIINDILDFSKIEAGKLELHSEPFNLREVVEDVGEIFTGLAYRKGIELAFAMRPDAHVAYRGDSGRLRQVLINLVGNAVKFTDEGEVAVALNQLSRDSGRSRLRFEVRDTGTGIPIEAQARIFDAFSQLDGSSTRQHGGTGLGLGISRQLVSLMGGEIGMESSPGSGSCFWFTVTLDEEADEAVDPEDMCEVFLGRRVIVVDDNATNRGILAETLEFWGLAHESVSDAGAALHALRSACGSGDGFEAALLDVHMPGVGGLDLARTIKADPALRHTAVAILSSVSDDFADIRREVGIEAHLTKPIRQRDLRGCLASLLSGSSVLEAGADTDAGAFEDAAMGARVLVAEDNPVNQDVAIRMLELLGCEAEVVVDGEAAVASFERGCFDLVLMDCQMPRMDGYEATSRMRDIERQRGLHRTPIVALTANAFSDVRERCLGVGMDDFVTKPFTAAALREVMSRLIPAAVPSAVTSPQEAASGAPDVTTGMSPEQAETCATLDPRALERLYSLRRDDAEDVLGRFAGMYRSTAGELLARLSAAVAGRDAQEINDAAHSLKSASASIGAAGLSSLCKELEAIGVEGAVDQAAAMLAKVEREYRAVCRALERVAEAEQAA
jgi:signal transduction histidine kinase/CheY-like chemotaxis protein